MERLHPDEIAIDVELVRGLVEQSFPHLASEPVLRSLASGSSNSIYRLGRTLAVRLPRQPGGGATIRKEARWLHQLAPQLPTRIPHVLGLGAPGLGYPEDWSITTWVEGHAPRRRLRGSQSVTTGRDLARFITTLRDAQIPPEAISDPALRSYRGEPLQDFDTQFRDLVDECRSLDLDLDLDHALRLWDHAVSAAARLPPLSTWYHGDLLAENLLLGGDSGLSAVLDFGGLAIGNPLVDLVVAWDLLDQDGLAAFRVALAIDDDEWTAARGWALFLSLMTFPYYRSSMPGRCAARLAMARFVLAHGVQDRT